MLRRRYDCMMIDSAIVCTHHYSQGAMKRGYGSGHPTITWALTTKIHAIYDTLGKLANSLLCRDKLVNRVRDCPGHHARARQNDIA